MDDEVTQQNPELPGDGGLDRGGGPTQLRELRLQLESLSVEIRNVEQDLERKNYFPFGRRWEKRRFEARLDDLHNQKERVVQAIAQVENASRRRPQPARDDNRISLPGRSTFQPSTGA